jgi:hypothetical protein
MATEQLTYAQIAERLGASVEAARAIVTRHHLPRSRSNDGKTLVSIDVKEIQHRRLPARSPGNHQAHRLAATKDQLVAELQAVRALQEAAQVNERISTLEAELAAEQQRSASHLADYEQERDRASYAVLRARAGELLSECISNGPYLLNRALRRVMMSAVQVVDHSGYATRITVTAGNRALQDVTLVVSRSWEVLRARCTNMDALPNKSIASTRLFFTLVGAGAFNLLGRLRQIGRVAWFRFIFVLTSPIRLVARMLLSIFPHADPPAIWGKPEVRPNSRLQGFRSTTLRWLWGTW